MLNSSLVGDSGKTPARRSAFSQTCTLLSQFMKEKKAIGDLGFEMPSSVDARDSNNSFRRTTMNLFPVNEGAEEVPNPMNGKSTFPMPNSSEVKSAPMTIFYAGQVIVFNDFPANKAKEIINLASKGVSQIPNTTVPVVTINDEDADNKNNQSLKKSMVDSTAVVLPNLSGFPAGFSNNPQMQDLAQKSIPQTNDLPIARKASLHRFLEKRKDRITAKAPYSVNKPREMSANSKPKESDSWLGLAAAGTPTSQP